MIYHYKNIQLVCKEQPRQSRLFMNDVFMFHQNMKKKTVSRKNAWICFV